MMRLLWTINNYRLSIVYRLLFIIKRKSIVLLKKIGLCSYEKSMPMISGDVKKLPPCLLNYKTDSIKVGGDEYTFNFINEEAAYAKAAVGWFDKSKDNGTRLWLLNLHYMGYLHNCTTDDFIILVNDWIDNVHPYGERYWQYSWNSFSLSIRVVNWIHYLSENINFFGDEFLNKVLSSIYSQIRFLLKNLELDIKGNHIVKNIKALIFASVFFKSKEASCWLDRGIKLLKIQLLTQINEDGMHFELSPSYHFVVLDDLIDIYCCLTESQRGFLLPILKKMITVVNDFSYPDGTIMLFNDSGKSYGISKEKLLYKYNKHIDSVYTFNNNFFLNYKSSGYYGCNFSNVKMIAKFGPIGPKALLAHAHADTFSYVCSIFGRPFIVDHGAYEYNAGNNRDIDRSTFVHNTVSIENKNSSDVYGSFRCGRVANVENLKIVSTKEFFQIEATHDGYTSLSNDLYVKRKIEARNSYIKVSDTASSKKVFIGRSSILFHPDVILVEKKDTEIILDHHGEKISITSSSSMHIEEANYCPDLGIKHKTLKVFIYISNSLPAEYKICF